MRPLYLISDIHAGIRGDGDDPARLADLRLVLEQASEAGGEVAILGDLFDFWWEWDEVVPTRHLPWLEVLGAAVRGGLPIRVFPGNHDFRLGGMLEHRLGLRHPGEWERFGEPGRSVVLHHGDGLDPEERGYLLMRKVFRSRWAQRGFNWLHPDLGMALADRMSRGDREPAWQASRLVQYLRRGLPNLLREGDVLAVMGHVHAAGMFNYHGTVVVTLPPFVQAARGWCVVEELRPRLEYLRPELAPPLLEEDL